MGSTDLINSSIEVKPQFFELSLGFSAGVSRGTFLWKAPSRARAGIEDVLETILPVNDRQHKHRALLGGVVVPAVAPAEKSNATCDWSPALGGSDEAYVPTQQDQAQTVPRIPRPNEDGRRSKRPAASSSQRTEEVGRHGFQQAQLRSIRWDSLATSDCGGQPISNACNALGIGSGSGC